MILVDKEIQAFLYNGKLDDPQGQTAIRNGQEDCITNIGYDLRACGFIRDETLLETYDLEPGESIFVESEETVIFDKNTCGTVHIKNSRLRMGLSLESPVYQPGHETRIYFRLTNLSDKTITLNKNGRYALLVFEQLHTEPTHPYDGTFQREAQYSGLAGYTSDYQKEIKIFEKRKVNLESMERSIYGNIITILSIFVAIFSIINVNFSLAQNGETLWHFFAYNLSLVGGIGFLSALIEEILHRNDAPKHTLWWIPAICFTILAALAIFVF